MSAEGTGVARLADRDDFDQLVNLVAEGVGLLPEWIRKDYWVVRVLDALLRAPDLDNRFVFKGGTSLSKAWKLIDRFSEDVDVLLTGESYGPVPGKGGRRKTFKAVQAAIENWTPLRLPLEGLTETAKRRYYIRADFHGTMRFPINNTLLGAGSQSTEWILIEAGFRGGSNPRGVSDIQSHIGEYILVRPELAHLAKQYSADVRSIAVPVLAPERTFVEKILAIHGAATGPVEELQVRHYYDLAQLFVGHSDVRRCLEEKGGFRELLGEAIEVSNTYFDGELSLEAIDLGQSPALVPSPEVRRVLQSRWRDEASLYPHGQPDLGGILEVIAQIRTAIDLAMKGR